MEREQARKISYRRYWLNRCLEESRSLMQGVVVDLGGRSGGTRFFRPPREGVLRWVCINIDPAAHPEVFGDVCQVPLQSGSADTVVCTEVLEHLSDPQACVGEAFRLLKPGGVFLGSAPFIYPIHSDPLDFTRFTDQRIHSLCAAFRETQVRPMGGYLGTLGMLIQLGVPERPWPRLLRSVLGRVGRWLCAADERAAAQRPPSKEYTTGFFWVARK